MNRKKQKVLGLPELGTRQSIKSTQENRYFKNIVETIHESLLVLDSDLRVLFANRSFYNVFKITERETIGNLIYDLGNRQWDIPKLRTSFEEILLENKRFNDIKVECVFSSIGRRIMLLNARQIANSLKKQPLILLAIEDVTNRMHIEQALQTSEERFRRAFETAKDGILLVDKISGLILNSNQAAQDFLGISLKDIQKSKLWKFGFIKDEKDFRKATIQLEEKGSIDFHDTWIKTRDGKELTADVYLMDKAKVIQCCLRDITERNKADEMLQETMAHLRRAIETTIQVLVQAVEVRDPYTAGHQKRVSNLARLIATEMKFSIEKIEGIRLAGSIHDVGKISTPSEILSKPTRLTDLEFYMVKEHAQKGYEILKDVKSPWPLADIVHQHHERMDGSGYPQGLKGEDLLLDSRILIVADVVEAMASHRPYRAALGIDAALEEIKNNKATLYDPEVVDTCLNLFNNGFEFQ